MGPGKLPRALSHARSAPTYFAHQVVMVGMPAFQAVAKDLFRFGIVVTPIEHPDFGRPKAGMISQAENGAVADGIDHGDEALRFPRWR